MYLLCLRASVLTCINSPLRPALLFLLLLLLLLLSLLLLFQFHCSLPVPFYSDRLGLRSDPRWSKLAAEFNETRVVWAGNIIKINRQDGKVGVTREPSSSTPPSLWVTPPPRVVPRLYPI